MALLSPSWIWLGFLALPILIMYMLRLRRRNALVSSILLWQSVLRDRQANAPWQRLKRNLLLILQLMILAALVFSLARPGVKVPSVTEGSLVVLLDASASMASTDVEPNRFEAARGVVAGLINSMNNNTLMTIIQVAQQPTVLTAGESNHENLTEALFSSNLTHQEADWLSAFNLAASAISNPNTLESTVIVVSDGGLPASGLPSLPAEVKYIPVGASDHNLAISALAMRPAGTNNELFARVNNYSQISREAILSIYLDEYLVSAQEINIPANGQTGITLTDFPPTNGIITARITGIDGSSDDRDVDFLESDNTAFAINRTSTNRGVLLMSPGNLFLDQILANYPGIQPFKAVPETSSEGIRFSQPTERFDLYVLDEVLPTTGGIGLPEFPEGNLLLINPPNNPLFPVTGVITPTSGIRVNDHPVSQLLDWENVHIRQARRISVPDWAEIVIDSPDGPLLIVGESQGRRIAALTFDLNDSDLPLQVAFPILFSNLVEYLLPPSGIDTEARLVPGQSIRIQIPTNVDEVIISSPFGSFYTIRPSESSFFYSHTQELGVYAVNFLTEDSTSTEYFSTNLFSQFESNINPKNSIQVGRTTIPVFEQEDIGLRDIWPWFATFALIMLAIEWWVYHRRSLMPKTEHLQFSRWIRIRR